MLFFVVSFLASVVGAICGIGGGVIIKPVLDLIGMGSATTINFLSGCTVLSMSCYSVGKAFLNRDSKIDLATATPLAIGAAVGGVAGKQMFTWVKGLFSDPEMVSGVQAVCLGLITVGCLVYTIHKSKIPTVKVVNKGIWALIGMLLGIMSSFLGIGGGPINLVVLGFLGMDTKTAAANSLYTILFSQMASLGATLVTRSVPEFQWVTLILMVAGGIGGGIVGRSLNKRMDNRAVDKLFVGLMAVIVLICVYNAWKGFA